MKLNKEGKVTHFIDMWNHKEPSTNPVIYVRRRCCHSLPSHR